MVVQIELSSRKFCPVHRLCASGKHHTLAHADGSDVAAFVALASASGSAGGSASGAG
ncbi:MAG: hypothetical protein ACOCXI_10030 [Chloroflexota bacterium]